MNITITKIRLTMKNIPRQLNEAYEYFRFKYISELFNSHVQQSSLEKIANPHDKLFHPQKIAEHVLGKVNNNYKLKDLLLNLINRKDVKKNRNAKYKHILKINHKCIREQYILSSHRSFKVYEPIKKLVFYNFKLAKKEKFYFIKHLNLNFYAFVHKPNYFVESYSIKYDKFHNKILRVEVTNPYHNNIVIPLTSTNCEIEVTYSKLYKRKINLLMARHVTTMYVSHDLFHNIDWTLYRNLKNITIQRIDNQNDLELIINTLLKCNLQHLHTIRVGVNITTSITYINLNMETYLNKLGSVLYFTLICNINCTVIVIHLQKKN